MTESGTDKKPIQKAKEAGQKLADKLEPDEESAAAGGASDASSPFSDGERPDEQPTSDTPGGGLG